MARNTKTQREASNINVTSQKNTCSYTENHRRSALYICALFVLLIISVCLGILMGSVKINPADIWNVLSGHDRSSTAYILITTVRIPRVLGGLFAGMGLACSGVILQSVMNNSLASPNTIGVNSGSGFAVMIGMMFFPFNMNLLPVFAFGGAFITSILVFTLAYMADSSRTTIVLAGITISSFLNAGINAIKLLDTDISVNITTFMIGSLSGLTYGKILLPGILVIISVIISFLYSGHLNVLGLGEDIARSLGININLTRLVLLMLASVMAGCIVSYAGLLSFIGLIVPHICRRLFGNDARFLLPCSALLGSGFVLLCDLAGRVIFAPYELPAGIIMAFIGGPFFLYLLFKKKGGRRVNA